MRRAFLIKSCGEPNVGDYVAKEIKRLEASHPDYNIKAINVIATMQGVDGKVCKKSVTFPGSGIDSSPVKCSNCNAWETTANKLKACGGCRIATYCDKDCLTAAWKAGHKKVCVVPKQ